MNQFCTLDQAKRLQELGVIQDSMNYWHKMGKDWEVIPVANIHNLKQSITHDLCYSAWSTNELGEILPPVIQEYKTPSLRLVEKFGTMKMTKRFKIGYTVGEKETEFAYFCDGKTEAEARAKLLIFVLENDLAK